MTERRVGLRHQVDLQLEWVPLGPARLRGGGQRRFGRSRALVAEVFDLSVTGAGVIAPVGLQFGDQVAIGFEGHRGTAMVRRVDVIANTGSACYGIRFEILDNALHAHLMALLAELGPDRGWQWANAR